MVNRDLETVFDIHALNPLKFSPSQECRVGYEYLVFIPGALRVIILITSDTFNLFLLTCSGQVSICTAFLRPITTYTM